MAPLSLRCTAMAPRVCSAERTTGEGFPGYTEPRTNSEARFYLNSQ
jgi:hypothetical protein